MAIDVTNPQSRRALLAAGLGAIAATAAQALGRPNAALATNNQPVIQGITNAGTQQTTVKSTASTALHGWTTASDESGVLGEATAGTGEGTVGVLGLTHSD